MPSIAEHLYVSSISSGIPALAPAVLMGVHDRDSDGGVATKEAFDWACAILDLLLASGEKVGKNRKDVQSLVETYMTEHGARGSGGGGVGARVEAVSLELLPAAQLLVSLTSTMEVVYLGGKDGYTSVSLLKGVIPDLLLGPIQDD
uniref:Uncharacterized protein n=1 Tax=Oryza barthii TaxID=65489 RepID=A0A0D3FIR2_9ORYZ